jgi:hypothetical protein
VKIYYYIGIHLIAPNEINIEKLSAGLEEQIKKCLPLTYSTLEVNKSYWKDPTSSSIVYSFLNNQNTKIADILTLLPLSWEYSEGYVYNVDIQQRVDNEDAVWSKLCHPEEFFLMPEIKWVHMYTWETNKEPIIN